MIRTLTGNIEAEVNTLLAFTLSDKYMHSLNSESIESIVGADGNYSIELEVNKTDECWVMSVGTKIFPLFIYEGDGDLKFVDALAHAEYPTLGLHLKTTSITNFSKLIDRYLKGEEITSLEEKRILCDYFKVASEVKSGDIRMCNIDKGLADV